MVFIVASMVERHDGYEATWAIRQEEEKGRKKGQERWKKGKEKINTILFRFFSSVIKLLQRRFFLCI